jgi:hypothetical protein
LLASLPGRARTFAAAGVGAARLTAADQLRLDAHYLLVRTGWTAPSLTGAAPATLASSYLLHDAGGSLQIVAYLNHKTVAP